MAAKLLQGGNDFEFLDMDDFEDTQNVDSALDALMGGAVGMAGHTRSPSSPAIYKSGRGQRWRDPAVCTLITLADEMQFQSQFDGQSALVTRRRCGATTLMFDKRQMCTMARVRLLQSNLKSTPPSRRWNLAFGDIVQVLQDLRDPCLPHGTVLDWALCGLQRALRNHPCLVWLHVLILVYFSGRVFAGGSTRLAPWFVFGDTYPLQLTPPIDQPWNERWTPPVKFVFQPCARGLSSEVFAPTGMVLLAPYLVSALGTPAISVLQLVDFDGWLDTSTRPHSPYERAMNIQDTIHRSVVRLLCHYTLASSDSDIMEAAALRGEPRDRLLAYAASVWEVHIGTIPDVPFWPSAGHKRILER
jgi:hypothetical protein